MLQLGHGGHSKKRALNWTVLVTRHFKQSLTSSFCWRSCASLLASRCLCCCCETKILSVCKQNKIYHCSDQAIHNSCLTENLKGKVYQEIFVWFSSYDPHTILYGYWLCILKHAEKKSANRTKKKPYKYLN